MEFSDDVAKLAIQNVKVISESYHVMEDIDNSLYEYIEKYLKDYIKHNEDWRMEDKYDTFGPSNWPKNDNKYQVYYSIAPWGEDNFWSLHVAGIDGRGMGIALIIETSLQKGADYSQRLADFLQQHERKLPTARLIAPSGGRKKYLFFPMKTVSLETLAETYPNWEDALEEPLKKMLESLEKAHKTINTFVLSLK